MPLPVEAFILAILGHLLGDFMLQTKWMALTKSNRGREGIIACTLHVTVYTLAVCGLLLTFSPWFVAAVFIPHWIIDRWSLASLWLKLIRGRTFESALTNKGPYREFDIAFTSIVYTVVDNTMHALCLWAAVAWWFR